jgi:cardiolipin synthase
MGEGALLLGALALVGFVWPRIVAWPLSFLCLWFALALLGRALRRRRTPAIPGRDADPLR